MREPARIREISPGESIKPFIDVAWRFNAADPNWIPPLRMAVTKLLDREKHPFHEHAEVAYFVAEHDGEVVGRIAAIVNHLHNEFHNERTGFFGFFECENDPDTARQLISAASAWLRAREMDRMRGPTNFSTNEECGLLVDGFETPPMIMMPHNPPYYARLMDAAGLEKGKDLLAYWLDDPNPPERLVHGLDRVLKRANATIRSFDMKKFDAEVAAIKEVYNSAWSQNWGFVPMTDAEFAEMTKELRPVVDPDLCLIAEVEGEPIGFSLALPDLNQALKHLPNGKLFPFGIFKFLWAKRRLKGMRVLTLGFKPGYQHQGIGPAFYVRTLQIGASKGYTYGEASWILEDNWGMRRPLEKMGGRAYKTYRIYETAL